MEEILAAIQIFKAGLAVYMEAQDGFTEEEELRIRNEAATIDTEIQDRFNAARYGGV